MCGELSEDQEVGNLLVCSWGLGGDGSVYLFHLESGFEPETIGS